MPSHYTSIWMDRDFSAWVAPISNRLSGGGVLYTDGWHSPVSPLSSLAVYAVSGGHATWITESALIFLFQCALLLVMYGVLRTIAPSPVPFASVIASVPVIFALPKLIFYDALPQFLVALAIAAIGRADGGEGRRWTIVTAAICATAFLAKTTTGLGATAGALVVLALTPRDASVASRLRGILVFVAAFVAVTGGWLLALHRWMSLPGFLHDVLLNGSTPKGGAIRMLRNLASYPLETVVMLVPLVLAAWIASLLAGGIGRFPARPDEDPPSHNWRRAAIGAAALTIAALVAAKILRPIDEATDGVMWCGFALLAGAIYTSLRGITLPGLAGFAEHHASWARMSIVAIAAAAVHALSVKDFRWVLDNNPLNVLAIAAVMAVLLHTAGAMGSRAAFAGRCVAAVFVGACYVHLMPQVNAAIGCRERWPEIAYLEGARLRPAAAGMRRLVAEVRTLAPDATRDTVLLLPEDPNVGAWFERPRPTVTSAILFVDQYLDAYVDEDFHRLSAAPPKVIVIGPRLYWRGFSQGWLLQQGVERLIDRIQAELLPARYRLAPEQPISFQQRTDYMDVYVRLD